jgi:hypothetical protein
MPGTQFVFDTAGNGIGEIIKIFVVHLLEKCDQFLDRLTHRVYLLVAATATITIETLFGAFTVTWFEFHPVLPLA